MQMYYSPSGPGFYAKEIHSVLPDDAVPIPQELYLACAGKRVVTDANGMPSVYAEPPPSAQDIIRGEIENLERKYMLPRVVREVLLASAEKEAAERGVDPMVNAGYQRLKEFDDQIAALRAQL